MVGRVSLEAGANNFDISGPACTGGSLQVTSTVSEFRDVEVRSIKVVSVFCEALPAEQGGWERSSKVRKRKSDADTGRRPEIPTACGEGPNHASVNDEGFGEDGCMEPG